MGVRRVAVNPVYAGLRSHNGVVAGKGKWDELVSEATWAEAVARMDDPERKRTGPRRRYLLTGGVLRCGKCGAVLRSKQHIDGKGNRTARYVCPSSNAQPPGCGGVSIKAEDVEQLVTEWVLAAVASDEFTKSLAAERGSSRKALAEVRALESRLDRLADMLGNGQMQVREWERASKSARAALEEARQLATIDTTAAAVGSWPQARRSAQGVARPRPRPPALHRPGAHRPRRGASGQRAQGRAQLQPLRREPCR